MTAAHGAHAHAPSAERQWAEGLTVFAAVTLMIAGALDVLRGITGIAEDDVSVTTRDYVFAFDLTGWGWIHLVPGALAVIVGLGLFREATWARVAGVAIAGLVVIANFPSLPYHPVRSVVVIAFRGFVVRALCVSRSGAGAFGR